ncbi:hypothetical protein [Streptomyces sp. NPDC002156]
MNGRSPWIATVAGFLVWWGLATMAFRLFGMIIDDLKSWPTSAGMAAVSVATGELSERWHRRRRRTMPQTSPTATTPETGCTTSAPDKAGNSGERQ